MTRHGLYVFRILFVVAAMPVMSLSVFAMSPTEYRTKVDAARNVVSALLLEISQVEADIDSNLLGNVESKEIRRLMPVSQKVETANGTVETSNQWLHDRLNDFDATNDIQIKANILTEIDERLTTISWSVNELEQAVKSDRSKDEDKQKLNEILLREEYQKPPEQKESQMEKWLKSVMEWIMSWLPQPSGQSSEGSFTGLQGFSYLLRVILIGLIVMVLCFGLYKLTEILFPNIKSKKREKRKDRVVLGETIGAEQSAETLFNEAEKLAHSGDIRMAIRKGYIALLCELNDRKIIGLQRYKTNRDYLRDVRSNGGLHSNMSSMTGIFEQHWYGRAATSDELAWSEFRERYRNAIASSH